MTTTKKQTNRKTKTQKESTMTEIKLAPELKTETLRKEINRFNAECKEAYVEREEAIDLGCWTLLAGEHMLLLGLQGTAKSAMANAFCNALYDKNANKPSQYFRTLMTRFQLPEELLGPYSAKLMAEEDRLVHKSDHYMPTGDVVFLDELFKGSSAILNSLLTALNEQQWLDDGQMKDLPVMQFWAAANKLPSEEDGLEAFHDRFLGRCFFRWAQRDESARRIIFGTVRKTVNGKQITERVGRPKTTCKIDITAVREIQKRLKTDDDFIPVSQDAEDAILKIRRDVSDAGIPVSDRRYYKAVKVLRARAWMLGLDQVGVGGLDPLKNMLWNEPGHIEQVNLIVSQHGPDWVSKLAEVDAVAVEQSSRLEDSLRKASTRGDKLKAISDCQDKLGVQMDIMEQIVRESPGAKSDVRFSNLVETLNHMMEYTDQIGKGLGF